MDEALIPRYGRQMLLPGMGAPGQRRLLQSKAVIVGAGGEKLSAEARQPDSCAPSLSLCN